MLAVLCAEHWIEALVVPDDRVAPQLQPYQALLHAPLLYGGQRVFADEVRFAEVHLPAKPDLVGVVLDVHVLPIGQYARLQPAQVAGRDDAQVELLALLQDVRPNVVGVDGCVVQIDLEAHLGREAGARDGHVVAVELVAHEAVVWDIADAGTKHLLHQRRRLGALYLNGGDVDFVDLDVVAGARVYPLRPEQHVGVGYAEPELVLRHAKQHRVVYYSAYLVAQNHVPRRHRREHLCNVASDEQVHEVGGVRSLDLYLALAGDVPHRHVVGKVPVLLDKPAVLWLDVRPGVVNVVVGGVSPGPGLLRQVPPGGLPYARRYQHLGVAVPTLPEIYRHAALLEFVDYEVLSHSGASY